MLKPSSLRLRAWASSLLTASLLIGVSGPAAARQNEGSPGEDQVAVAEQKAARAFTAYRDKRYADAVALYIEAYDAAPNADMLYNVARIYDGKLADRPLAISFYRRYIADPGAVSDRIQIANARLGQLRAAELAVMRPVPAENSPPVMPGAASAESSAGQPPTRDASWSEPEIAGVIIGASGIVALGVGAGFGIAAMGEANTARDLCDGNVCREQRGIDAAEKASDRAMISTVGFASGGALLALGAAVYFWLGGAPSEAVEQASDEGVRLSAGLSHRPKSWGLEMGGTW